MFITVHKSLEKSKDDLVHVDIPPGRFIPRCLRVY